MKVSKSFGENVPHSPFIIILNAFSLENSFVCYDSEQQCNYIYAISKKKNYQKEGCYDDDKITEIDKSADYSIPQFTNFEYQYEDNGSSLVVDIDWYDEGSDIILKRNILFKVKQLMKLEDLTLLKQRLSLSWKIHQRVYYNWMELKEILHIIKRM